MASSQGGAHLLHPPLDLPLWDVFSGGLLNFTGDKATLTNFVSLQKLSSGRLEKSQSCLLYYQRTQAKEQTCLEFVMVQQHKIVNKSLSMQEG